jgi:hypothetical protein
MDFDDSLTPEIPIDQAPDADPMESDSVDAAPPDIGFPDENKQVGSTLSSSLTVPAGANGAATEPDLELLAVLLKNPQLVFALSSNQVGNLPNDQTVALLDMLKQTGLGLSELVNSLANGAGVPKEPEPGPEMIPTSLPSPTPPKDLPASVSLLAHFVCFPLLMLHVLFIYVYVPFGRRAGHLNSQRKRAQQTCRRHIYPIEETHLCPMQWTKASQTLLVCCLHNLILQFLPCRHASKVTSRLYLSWRSR